MTGTGWRWALAMPLLGCVACEASSRERPILAYGIALVAASCVVVALTVFVLRRGSLFWGFFLVLCSLPLMGIGLLFCGVAALDFYDRYRGLRPLAPQDVERLTGHPLGPTQPLYRCRRWDPSGGYTIAAHRLPPESVRRMHSAPPAFRPTPSSFAGDRHHRVLQASWRTGQPARQERRFIDFALLAGPTSWETECVGQPPPSGRANLARGIRRVLSRGTSHYAYVVWAEDEAGQDPYMVDLHVLDPVERVLLQALYRRK